MRHGAGSVCGGGVCVCVRCWGRSRLIIDDTQLIAKRGHLLRRCCSSAGLQNPPPLPDGVPGDLWKGVYNTLEAEDWSESGWK